MRKDVTGGYAASSSVWCSLPESEMCAVLVVVANILREATFQVAFVNCNDVIQEITPATPYPTLCNSILPRTLERSAERIHPQGSNRCRDFQAILGITIKDDEPRSGSKWKCFSKLLHDPQACRMLCDIEVQDTPTVVTDDEKAIERAEGDRRNREQVHRGNRFPVIAEKGKPAPGWLRISRRPFHPTRDRSLRDIKTEHAKLAMDAWRSPRWVLNDHSSLPDISTHWQLNGREAGSLSPNLLALSVAGVLLPPASSRR